MEKVNQHFYELILVIARQSPHHEVTDDSDITSSVRQDACTSAGGLTRLISIRTQLQIIPGAAETIQERPQHAILREGGLPSVSLLLRHGHPLFKMFRFHNAVSCVQLRYEQV